jgi:hypothetical protein
VVFTVVVVAVTACIGLERSMAGGRNQVAIQEVIGYYYHNKAT